MISQPLTVNGQRTTRYVMLGHLPDVHTAEAVRDGLVDTMATLPAHLRGSLTWDQGSEMATHKSGDAHRQDAPRNPHPEPTNLAVGSTLPGRHPSVSLCCDPRPTGRNTDYGMSRSSAKKTPPATRQ